MKYLLLLLLLLSGCNTVAPSIPSIRTEIVAAAPAPEIDFNNLPPTAAGIASADAKEEMQVQKVNPKKVTTPHKISKVVAADKILDQLEEATFAFSMPDKININDKISARLIIDFKSTEKELLTLVNPANNNSSGRVLVSKIVNAELISDGFNITPITLSEQALADTQPTEWNWDLSPKSAGKYDVKLTINAIVEVDGRQAHRHIKTFEKIITVEITKQQIIVMWIKKYWQWIFTALILPLIKWGYSQYKLKKETT